MKITLGILKNNHADKLTNLRTKSFPISLSKSRNRNSVNPPSKVSIETQILTSKLHKGSVLSKVVYFNLTTTRHWRTRPVGIVRVERELAKYLYKNNIAQFIFWDPIHQSFIILEGEEVKAILDDAWLIPGDKLPKDGSAVSEVRQCSVNDQDTIVSIGVDWEFTLLDDLIALRGSTSAKLVAGCHDIVPIIYPECCVRPDFDKLFLKHFVDMAHEANAIFCNSENTKNDLNKLLTNIHLTKRLPDLVTIPLGSDNNSHSLNHTLDHEEMLCFHNLASGGRYVLYVSSIEPRKNHAFLLNVWAELLNNLGDECPQLVFVGQPQWGSNELIQQIKRTHLYKQKKLHLFSGISDNLLKTLYASCFFSVFPSLYEGWGLGASEAMQYGKVCIISNSSSLGEATQDLMPSLHPLDHFAWFNLIQDFSSNNSLVSELEQKIQNVYRRRTWEDFSKDFCDNLILAPKAAA